MGALLAALNKKLQEDREKKEREGGTEYDPETGKVRYTLTKRDVEDEEAKGGDETYGHRNSHTSK